MRPLGKILAMAAVSAAVAAQAGEPVVVELYTSQGCSACPPADAFLAELAKRRDVIALSLHVDYWDYLGWADAFATPEHTKRQKKLAKLRGERMLYTPQIVVDGRSAVVGSDRTAVEAAIADAAAHDDPVRVTFRRDGELLLADARSDAPLRAQVVYMVYDGPREVEIERGENSGLTVSYVNTVRAMMSLGDWSGVHGVWRLPAPSDALGAALIVQGEDGVVMGAASFEFGHE
jgi:hypothetical protein